MKLVIKYNVLRYFVDHFVSSSCVIEMLYSKTCLKRTYSKADNRLKRTKTFAPKYQFTGQSVTNITCLKRTLSKAEKWLITLIQFSINCKKENHSDPTHEIDTLSLTPSNCLVTDDVKLKSCV